MYKTAKYLGDIQALVGASEALKKGRKDRALNIVKRRVVSRVSGKLAGRGMGYARGQTRECFIATEVYGDVNAPEVQKLREYRDEVLMNSWLGRNLVNFYYSGAGKRIAYLLGRDWRQTIPTIRRGLDYVIEKYDSQKHTI